MVVEFELIRQRSGPASPPILDETQQRVVDHAGGPLLVLAGPGTGKTTTLVELVSRRIESGTLSPDDVLVLTFSRRAAAELRSRIAARTNGAAVTASTFHSFCYGLVREFSDPEGLIDPPELLSAPRRDAIWAELLAGHDVRTWPEHLRPALRTRGFAAEVQAFMDQLAVLGLDTGDLRRLAVERERTDWARVAEAIEEYHGVLDLQNLADYTDLVARAVGLSSEPVNRELLRSRYRLVVVDEYQDTDRLQVKLLEQLAGDGHDLVAVGDHDQAIYGFRGADVSGMFEFPRIFATRDGEAPVLPLGHTRRFGERILTASRHIIASTGTPGGIPGEVLKRHRGLSSSARDPGSVFVERFVSPSAESDHIAALLRRAHLADGRPWSQMAVLVRTGAEISRLQNALIPAGVPVEVDGDEVPLIAEPAVRSLLSALELADRIAAGGAIEPAEAEALLSGPLAELDAAALRRLARALRRRDPETSSERLLAKALSEPVLLGVHSKDLAVESAIREAERLVRVLHTAARQIRASEPPEQALWTLWEHSGWSDRLIAQWESGREARVDADRDLDAVTALFDHAARVEERGRRRSVRNFIEDVRAQQIPATDISASAVRVDAVRLMTAHRSKGLQWPIVVVAGVQDGSWPDLRLRASLLGPELLAGAAPPSRRDRLREERRLFYVACTRAAEQLVVTCVDSPSEDGDSPSRFVTELLDEGFGRSAAEPPRPRMARPVTLRGIAAELRLLAADHDEALASEAASQLAMLADSGLGASSAADQDNWWGIREITASDVPVRPTEAPVRLSASQIDAISTCPLRWFLSHEAHGDVAATTSQSFGLVIHALAADVVNRRVIPDAEELKATLDSVWHRLDYAAPWIAEREREEAHQAIDRFVDWHVANREDREVLAAEHPFDIICALAGDEARLTGQIDRVERDSDGRAHAVDFKTGSADVPPRDVAEHTQLGIYQFVVNAGGCAELLPGATSGGAELVQLRIAASTTAIEAPKVRMQDPLDFSTPNFATERLAASVRTVRAELFDATENKHCDHCQFATLCPARSAATVGDVNR